MAGRVQDRVAVVTGGAMGMGNGCAEQLVKEGAKVTILDLSDSGIQAAANLAAKYGTDVDFIKVDVSDAEQMKVAYDSVAEKYGTIDIAVNAAGIGRQKFFFDIDDDWLTATMQVNFKGVWNACKAALPYMVKQNYGKIVNFCSVTGLTVVDPGMTHYAASKGAIYGLTKALASEFAGNNITVNCIMPGMVDTPMARNSFKESDPENWEDIAAAVAAAIPMGRMGTIEEAGKVALFLASDDSSYVTAQGIIFDGGSTLPETAGFGWEPA